MPRVKEPISLLEAKNRSHLSKSEIKARRVSEIKAPSDKIEAPEYLSAAEKKQFNAIAEELMHIGIMSNLDVDMLARFVIANAFYIKITKLLRDKEVQSDVKILEKAVNIQDKFFKQCQSAAREMGLTITSRAKLVVPKKEEPKENKFSKFQK